MPGIPTFAAPFVALALASSALAATPAPVTRPAKLGLCAACHGEDGRGRAIGTPNLAGQDETYLRNALAAYRNGVRLAQPMNAVAGTLGERDIQALARWYASRPPVPAK
jgi:cytochrome c553